ncbi:hypothetical protein B0J12DRAFT_640396 [Macrophomina phaseolina]|uniref:Six-bladed beta-propeller TolB-like protein n=1 Tax=Macrophomina phaseolina TaxID=35725 RepID=A0ABQ8GW40_9PEZI|nr:hypothetical protein B0J12DRAFT_640396 [Macrophomina phaseolina]
MIVSKPTTLISTAAAAAAAALLATTANATPLLPRAPALAAAQTLYQFPDGTWLENIAARPNGNLLVTVLSPAGPPARLYEIDPSSPSAPPSLVHAFDAYESLLGIDEVAPDVFALIAGNTSTLGPYAIWTVDLSKSDGGAAAEKVADVPGAQLLNGLTALPGGAAVLVTDTFLGKVSRVDLAAGEAVDVLADAETMTPPTEGNVLLGVNGVRFVEQDGKSWVYYTNSGKELFARVEVDAETGLAKGKYELLARGLAGDDFAVKDGWAYVAEGWKERVVRVSLVPGGGIEVVVGSADELTVAGATSAVFGRREGVDDAVLYVATSGAQEVPVNGVTEGGKVVAVDIGGWR